MPPVKKRIKILYEFQPFVIGGMEKFLYTLTKYLDKKKFEPIIASHGPSQFLLSFNALGIETKTFDLKKGVSVSSSLLKFLKESKVDLVQSNYYSVPVALTSHAAHIPHIWYPSGHIDVAYPRFTKQEKRCLLNLIYNFSSKVICPSNFIKDQFHEFKKSKVKVIYCGINPSETNSQLNISLSKNISHIKRKHLNIGMIAHLEPQKRHIDFIRAAKKTKKALPHARFFIIGGSYRDQKSLSFAQSLHQMTRRMEISRDILFTGFCKNVPKIMANMDLIVLPSIDEGFGLALIEAMAMGKPVIGTHSGAFGEVIEHEKTGLLIPPKNPLRLAQAMIQILKNPDRARQMGRAGEKRVQKLFDIADCVGQYECLYQKTLMSPNDSRQIKKISMPQF